MDVAEAPPEQAVDGSLDLERAVSLGVARRNEILRLTELTAELGLRAVLAEKRLDEALGSAHRYQAESIRLHAENRGLRDRVEALTRANHARSLRVWLGSRVRRAGWSR